ncbi:hypothetical protein Drorol1_Dr00024992, partial [Drosera rotundifolia]
WIEVRERLVKIEANSHPDFPCSGSFAATRKGWDKSGKHFGLARFHWAGYVTFLGPIMACGAGPGIERKGRKTPCFRGDTAARGAQPHGDSAAAIHPSHSHPFTAHHQEITTAGHPRCQKHTFPSLKGDGCHSRSSSPTSVL